LKVFRQFSRLVEALETVGTRLEEILQQHQGSDTLSQRLDQFELRQAKWEAEVEAVLLKAEGKLNASNNAEARARTMKKAYETHFDPFDEDGQEAIPAGGHQLSIPDATGSEEEIVYPVHMGVAPDNRTSRLRAKWGVPE